MSNQVPHWLYRRQLLTPNAIAMTFQDKTWTYKQLHTQAVETAYQLAACGVRKGSHIGLLSANHPQFVHIVHALSYIGAVIVCLNTRLTEEELTYQLTHSDVDYLFIQDHLADKYSFSHLATHRFSELTKQRDRSIQLQKTIDLDEPFTIMYTSGTTGKPKGVVHTYRNHWASAEASLIQFGLEKNDCWLVCLPMFHIGGFSIIVRTVMTGMSMHVCDRFDTEEIHRVLKSGRVTMISLVAVMLERLLLRLEADEQLYPGAIRCMLLGGSAVQPHLLKRAKQKKLPIYQSYGMTETTSQIVTNVYGEELIIGSSGKPVFTAQVKIHQPDNFGIGEILVKGPMVTNRYYNNEKATNDMLKDDWLYTGDIGRLDETGNLFVLERRTDLIISGGENIYPQEVERVLESHPSVRAAGVVGIKDQKWGQVPVAFVEVIEGITDENLLSYTAQKLAKYKLPKRIYFIEQLPRNAMGKLQRQKLLQYV